MDTKNTKEWILSQLAKDNNDAELVDLWDTINDPTDRNYDYFQIAIRELISELKVEETWVSDGQEDWTVYSLVDQLESDEKMLNQQEKLTDLVGALLSQLEGDENGKPWGDEIIRKATETLFNRYR